MPEAQTPVTIVEMPAAEARIPVTAEAGIPAAVGTLTAEAGILVTAGMPTAEAGIPAAMGTLTTEAGIPAVGTPIAVVQIPEAAIQMQTAVVRIPAVIMRTLVAGAALTRAADRKADYPKMTVWTVGTILRPGIHLEHLEISRMMQPDRAAITRSCRLKVKTERAVRTADLKRQRKTLKLKIRTMILNIFHSRR